MIEVNANAVKELRDKTGAGMMQCKKALQESGGDLEAAGDYLRKQGQVQAGKRADRVAKEGKVGCLVEGATAVLVELNSETDFVARNDDFSALLDNLLKVAVAVKPADLDAFMASASPVFEGRSIKDVITQKIAVIGENIGVRRVAVVNQAPGTKVFSYIHMGGKIGVLMMMKVTPDTALSNPVMLELGKDICLHICASNPLSIDNTGIPAAKIDKEREIYRAIAVQEGKPEKIIEKIVQGKVDKFFKESCLLDQIYVKDQEKSVGQHIADTAKAAGTQVQVVSFVRFQLGSSDE